LEAELATLEPPVLPDAGEAAAALANFGWFWDQERDASERNKILRLIFERVTVDDGGSSRSRRKTRSFQLAVRRRKRG